MTSPPIMQEHDKLLTPAEVGALFRVAAGTVARWRIAGKITGIPTPGGRLFRYRESDVRALLAASTQEARS